MTADTTPGHQIKINFQKESIYMTKEIKILKIKNRIDLLSERNALENANIIKKLRRQLRILEANN